jgi:RNA polymerase sigma-70 factor (ECF subfamily)
VTLDDEVSYALLVVMETLSPAERTAFVLHDLFGVSFDEIAAVVDPADPAGRISGASGRRPRTRFEPGLRVQARVELSMTNRWLGYGLLAIPQ